MATEITMPRLSDTMQQGTIVKWNVKEGQKVKSGDVIADIETDKATMELQTYDDGVIARLAVAEGQTVPVGTLIVLLAGPGEDAAALRASGAVGQGQSQGGAASAAKAAKGAGDSSPIASPAASSTAVMDVAGSATGVGAAASTAYQGGEGQSNGHSSQRVFASPLARKIAAERGVDISAIQGTGPSGRIVRKDVEALLGIGGVTTSSDAASVTAGPGAAIAAPHMATPQPAAAKRAGKPGQVVPLSNMRRTIARRLVESKVTIPHYQVTLEVEMDALVNLRTQLNEQLAEQGVKLSVNDFIVRACALAMRKHPYVNSRWLEKAPGVGDGGAAIELVADVNIGVAIALDEEKGGGLVVATLRHADQLGLRQISAQTRELSQKARSRGLTIEEMADSTFTISNLGMFGVDHFSAIINPPNVAILAVGAAAEKPVVRAGQLAVGWVMSMTMSSDHRVVDGAMAAQYLATVKELLQRPATLLV